MWLQPTGDVCPHHPGALGRRIEFVGLQVFVKPPDQGAAQIHRLAVGGVGRLEFIDEPLGVDPTE